VFIRGRRLSNGGNRDCCDEEQEYACYVAERHDGSFACWVTKKTRML
jgi:hypothetical protein